MPADFESNKTAAALDASAARSSPAPERSQVVASAATLHGLFPLKVWAWLFVIGGLFVLLFKDFIIRMGLIAMGPTGGDWSHAVAVPLISAYFVYQQRHRLARVTRRVCFPGLLILFAGMFGYAWGIQPIRNDMVQGYSMIVALFGLVLFLLGPAAMKILWLPIVYLAFAVKISDRIWSALAAHLQLLAAKAATLILQFLGAFLDLEASLRGTTIELSFHRAGVWITGQELNVAEACSGLRMLAAFMALGVLVAFTTPRAWWQRLTLTLLTVPIALAVNIGRVTVLGLLYPVNPEMAGGTFHKHVGLMMLIPALMLFLLAGWVLDRIYITESRPTESPEERPKSTGTAATIPASPQAARHGALAGGVMCLLLGITYGLVLVNVRPDLISDDWSSRWNPNLPGLLVIAVLMLLLGVWGLRRMLKPEMQGGGAPRALGVVAGVLLVSVLGLKVVVAQTKAVLIKQEIAPRRQLYLIPEQLGTWQRLRDDPALSDDMLEALGTRIYLSRVYQDTSLPPGEPGRLIKLHIAYYSGTPDTVPHVPDRCFVAGGMQFIERQRVELTLPDVPPVTDVTTSGPHMEVLTVPATVFTFGGGEAVRQANVIYFFSANGKFLASPDDVRLRGFDPRDRYSYYCKIEVLLPDIPDATAATRRAEQFLTVALPQIVACLPNWDDVKAGNWPRKGDAR